MRDTSDSVLSRTAKCRYTSAGPGRSVGVENPVGCGMSKHQFAGVVLYWAELVVVLCLSGEALMVGRGKPGNARQPGNSAVNTPGTAPTPAVYILNKPAWRPLSSYHRKHPETSAMGNTNPPPRCQHQFQRFQKDRLRSIWVSVPM